MQFRHGISKPAQSPVIHLINSHKSFFMRNTSILALICLTVFSASVSAQGIYKSPEDFNNGVISYSKTGDEKYAIRTDIPFNRSAVKVVSGDETIDLQKDELYGYQDANNNIYRFFNNSNYQILDQSGFLLYSRNEYIVEGKVKKRETRYYFSRDAHSPILPLSIHNLKHSFPANEAFHDMLDVHFRNDRELIRFDQFYKEYKIKRVFSKSIS